MQFQVPQFIDIEDKIFGPFTFKQFIYLVGGAGGAFMAYRLLPFYLAVFVIAPVIGLAFALSFVKVNNQPFIKVLESYIRYALAHKLYIWRREPKQKKEGGAGEGTGTEPSVESLAMPRISESKLKDLAWSLDVYEKSKRPR